MEATKIHKSHYGLRIFLGAFLPAPMGLVVISLPMNLEFRIGDIFDPGMILIMSVAYGFMLIPSAIYSFLMEHFVNPKITEHLFAVLASSVLGFLSGVLFGLGLGIIGAIVGLVLGIILRWSYTTSSFNEAPDVA